MRLKDIDTAAAAAGIDRVHLELPMLQYNDENALSYIVSLAFYAAREYDTIVRELPSGKGFAVCRFSYAKKTALTNAGFSDIITA